MWTEFANCDSPNWPNLVEPLLLLLLLLLLRLLRLRGSPDGEACAADGAVE